MGDAVTPDALVDPATYRARLAACLNALTTMLHDPAHHRFDPGPPRAGLELELVLTDTAGEPAMVNDAVLAAIDDPAFVPEIARWTIELNSEPALLAGDGLRALQRQVESALQRARAAAATTPGAPGIVMVGTLPTVRSPHLVPDAVTDAARYRHLDAAITAERGGAGDVLVRGTQTLRTTTDCIVMEGVCSSAQLHLPVTGDRFGPTYDAAQLIAGPQVALAANSPFHDGLHLWAESRVPLFTQAVDTRPVELRRQGVAPRVLLGGWADSVLDLYADDVNLYPPLVPELSEQDPAAVLAAGAVPALAELRMQTSTVWRWNRAVYDVAHGAAHLRIENRVLPAGPTPIDVMANAALFYGALAELPDHGPDPRQVPAATVGDDFLRCARHGMAAQVTWPGAGRAPVRDVLSQHLLPAARCGLERLDVDASLIETYLDVLTERAATGRTGAWWQVATVAALQRDGATRAQALGAMTLAYAARSAGGTPVHTWTPGA